MRNQVPQNFKGDFHTDLLTRRLYATDASIYQKIPMAVAFPRDRSDLRSLVHFARETGSSLIPRAAGTSLAGQCVGDGIVVDTGRYMNRILELDVENRRVRVEPGVIRDRLNEFLKPHGLFFGPNTSTANRCMMGGMVGNNSCGSTSIRYGSTRDHLLELETVLSDGSYATFKLWNRPELDQVIQGNDRISEIVGRMIEHLSPAGVQGEIRREFPDPKIHRRNSGYAVDLLLDMVPFTPDGPPLNLCQVLAGSEGTLALTSSITLHLEELPPPLEAVIAIHFDDLHRSLGAVSFVMESAPFQCELMDRTILECTEENLLYRDYRFFVEGKPEAILCVEHRANSETELEEKIANEMERLEKGGIGTARVVVRGAEQTRKVWALRSAGLGLLSNLPGDARPVAFVEDTVVGLESLPDYIREYDGLMKSLGQTSVYYAHAGDGEIHLRPVLDLKTGEGRAEMVRIAGEVARLVKKYRGSLSGEHGDGRVRAPFLPALLGDKNIDLLNKIKTIWDPDGIFNPGKIVHPLPMDQDLRTHAGPVGLDMESLQDFSDSGGILRSTEKCNGSGDCRSLTAGSMCPSYRASLDEKDTTRGRANTLRQILTERSAWKNPFDHPDLKEVLDLCLSCKACKKECPGNVDMAALKAEWSYQYYKNHRPTLRTRFFARFEQLAPILSLAKPLLKIGEQAPFLKKVTGISPDRSLPEIRSKDGFTAINGQIKKGISLLPDRPSNPKKLILLVDEFTRWNDPGLAEETVHFFTTLGYGIIPVRFSSARSLISKGFLKQARATLEGELAKLQKLDGGTRMVGVEPSALLSLRDDSLRLVGEHWREVARQLATRVRTFEEFVVEEAKGENIRPEQFTDSRREIQVHVHCHQKSLSSPELSLQALSIPENYRATLIPSSCCGMAGSFGYEIEHFAFSQKIGQPLFEQLGAMDSETWIAATGTSCRHQILDGTGKRASHPVSILNRSLRKG